MPRSFKQVLSVICSRFRLAAGAVAGIVCTVLGAVTLNGVAVICGLVAIVVVIVFAAAHAGIEGGWPDS